MSGCLVVHKPLSSMDAPARKKWDTLLASTAFGHHQQSFEFAAFRQAAGWKADFFWVEVDGNIIAGTVLLTRTLGPLPLGLGMMPSGPLWQANHFTAIRALLEAVGQHCRSAGVVFCRCNVRCPSDEFSQIEPWLPGKHLLSSQTWSYWNLSRASMSMDISGSLGDILQQMHRHVRSEYRSAQILGVCVRPGRQEQIGRLVELLNSTAERKGIRLREENRLRQLLQAYPEDRACFMLAEAHGEVIGATVAVVHGSTAYWLYGGFDYSKRQYHSNVLLQVETIRWAKERGCTSYDLGDACTSWPPSTTNKGYGVYQFKRRLGARALLMAPYCDLIYRPALYPLVRLAENVCLPLLIETGRARVTVAVQRLRTERAPANPVSA